MKMLLSRPLRPLAQPHLLPTELQQVIQTGNEEQQSGYSLPKLALSADLHRDRFGRPSVFIGRTAVCLDKPLERSAHQLSAAGPFHSKSLLENGQRTSIPLTRGEMTMLVFRSNGCGNNELLRNV
jgi:hypothetical protein